MKRQTILIIVVLLAVAMMTGCRGERYEVCEGSIWSTTYRIVYKGPATLRDSIMGVFHRVEKTLSPFNEHSMITAVNRNDTTVRADSLMRRVFEISRNVNRISGGHFDPTVSPLINLWGFGFDGRDKEPPSDEAIAAALETVGMRECSIDNEGRILKKNEGTQFNFSAVTKGYACDLVGEMFRRNGVENYMVEIGGEIALSGVNSRGEDWRIMVEAPTESDGEVVHEQMLVITPGGGGVASSGNYRNFHVDSLGNHYGHTISPMTGHPVVTRTLASTVTAQTCGEADALATACMAMPSDSAMAMVERLPGVEVMLVLSDGEKRTVVTTDGFKNFLR